MIIYFAGIPRPPEKAEKELERVHGKDYKRLFTYENCLLGRQGYRLFPAKLKRLEK